MAMRKKIAGKIVKAVYEDEKTVKKIEAQLNQEKKEDADVQKVSS